MAISYLVQKLVEQVRTDSDLNNSQVYTDDDLAQVISDAGSDLYDVFTGTWQKYNIKTFPFTLEGGVGFNAADLPDDFQQGHSIDVNPESQTPYTLKYLPNWLNRNSCSMPYQIFGQNVGPKAYTFLGSEIVILPAINAGGVYLLYYTPTWTPFAIPIDITVSTVTFPIVPNTTLGFGVGNQFILDTGPDTFFPTDAASISNFITVTGATNPSNDGSWSIVTYTNPTRVVVGGTTISETFPGGATVTLSRQSGVTAAGVWTFYGANQFTETTGDINVGDTLNVSGAINSGNNGAFVVLATGLNTVTTAATGLVTENFATGTVTVTVQPKGTVSVLPTFMNPWVQYIKTQSCITVRNKRGQDVSAFEQRLSVQKDRIQVILQERQEEPTQPPLTRRGDGSMGGGDGGLW